MINVDYLVTMESIKQWDILGERSCLKVNVFEEGKLFRCKDLSDFAKGKILMARLWQDLRGVPGMQWLVFIKIPIKKDNY